MPRFQGYFVAAYTIVGVLLAVYALSLFVRLRNARQRSGPPRT